ncbi:MAG: single-stranded DNA-binding protein [Anaerolineaceae bacterium]|nr:MAG: single-stranded DNA-binding protein [Anaerolineaceae bacterium]
MPTLNRVQLIGRLGRDPETKFTPTGKKVCHFSLAVTNRWKDKNGETRDSTEWMNIEAWGRLGEVCQEYLKKGSLVFVEGRLKTDKYEANDETKYFTKIVVQSLQFLDRKEKEEPVMAVDEDPGEYELAGE